VGEEIVEAIAGDKGCDGLVSFVGMCRCNVVPTGNDGAKGLADMGVECPPGGPYGLTTVGECPGDVLELG